MSALSVGGWVWGEQRNVCKVLDIQRYAKSGKVQLLVAHPQGKNVIIPLDKVRGFSDTPPLWAVPDVPKPLAVGQRCRLKGTSQTFTIIEIHSVRDGSDNGEPTYETWARLQTDDGKPAHWKLRQLEVIE